MPELGPEPQHPFGDQPLLGDPVLLDLEPETVRTEQPGEPLRARLGLLVLARPERVGDLARQAGGQPDDALGMRGEGFLVDPGPAVEPLGVPDRGEADQILVPGPVLGQEHEVTVCRRRPARLFPRLPGPVGEVGLEAENRADLLGLGLLVEAPGRVHVAVIGHGQAVHAQLLDVGDQLRNPVGPVEEGVFAVGVEVDERHRYRSRRSSSPHTCSSGTPRAWSRTRRW